MTASKSTSLFAARLKETRQASGLSQRKLGIAVGLDEFIAGSRINRYENGVHQPDIGTAHQLSRVLNVPVAYFYTQDEFMCKALLLLHQISPEQQEQTLNLLTNLLPTPPPRSLP
jgi:transcriptional regulator with XRE-family HTH domain